jgi:hypothetical protein
MDSYDSDSSDGSSESPSQSTVSQPPPFNDPNYETYKHGQQFLIVDHTVNQRSGSEVSKIWQHGGERRRVVHPIHRVQQIHLHFQIYWRLPRLRKVKTSVLMAISFQIVPTIISMASTWLHHI